MQFSNKGGENVLKNVPVSQINLNQITHGATIRATEAQLCKTLGVKIGRSDAVVKDVSDEINALCDKDVGGIEESWKKFSIKDYNNEHKNDTKQVSDLVKIGKWVHKNIKYNITFAGKNDITATETYKMKQGVCHHFTKLFNALMYSLGYKVIYVGGYAIKDNITFSYDNGHAWSLIKVNDEWLPFDATWGIFSGKLPLCHVFGRFNYNGTQYITTDSLKISRSDIEGKFIN